MSNSTLRRAICVKCLLNILVMFRIAPKAQAFRCLGADCKGVMKIEQTQGMRRVEDECKDGQRSRRTARAAWDKLMETNSEETT